MYISMSYHYSKYEFWGPESDLERYRSRYLSSGYRFSRFNEFFEPPELVCLATEFSVGACSDFRRNIPL